jgi:hypothetical protein
MLLLFLRHLTYPEEKAQKIEYRITK